MDSLDKDKGYWSRMLIQNIDMIIYDSQRQNISKLSIYWYEFGVFFENFLQALQPLWIDLVETGVFSMQTCEQYLASVNQARYNHDDILASNYLERGLKEQLFELIAYLEEHIELFPDKRTFEANEQLLKNTNWDIPITFENILSVDEYEKLGYCIERTSNGGLTVKRRIDQKEIYLHSNVSPLRDGAVLTDEWLTSGKDDYLALGFGLGYQYVHFARYQVMRTLTVYEEDIHLLEIAMGYTVLFDLLAHPNIKVVYDPGYHQFIHTMTQIDSHQTQLCLYAPSIYCIQQESIRNKIQALAIQMDNTKRYHDDLKRNFTYNSKHINHSVMELADEFSGKNVYLIGGGPSLEKNLLQLSHREDNSLVVCSATSFRMMISNGIRPDYVILTDPKPETYEKIQGLEQETIPLILLSTALWTVTKNYKGPKYIACQEGYDEAEKMAKDKGYLTFCSGSSVMTVAIDLALKLNCGHLIFMGMDLAFTDNRSHHSGGVQESVNGEYEVVEDVFGQPVKTTRNLSIYREWIEKRIQGLPKNKVIDATEGGAKICGTTIMSLSNWFAHEESR